MARWPGDACAAGRALSNQIVQTPQPLESSCPKCAGKPPIRGSQCVPVPVSIIQDETSNATGRVTIAGSGGRTAYRHAGEVHFREGPLVEVAGAFGEVGGCDCYGIGPPFEF